MAEHYYDEFVKISYRVADNDKQDPSPDDLREWDDTLHAHYGSHIPAALDAFGIPDTRRNRSILALMSQLSPGSGGSRVRRAAEYWANVIHVMA